jgi:lambda family phage portal protein
MSDIQIVDQHGRSISKEQDTAHFGASRQAREMANWNPGLMSADAANFGEIDTIAARAYDLDRNNGIASGAVTTSMDNIVGTGLRMSSKPDWRALNKTPEWAKEFGKIVESGWRSFSDSTDFDAARQQNFGDMSVTQLRTSFLSGEALALPLWLPNRPGVKWSTAIQSIDPARIAGPEGTYATALNRDGVEINQYGEAVAYYIRKNHPGDIFAIFGAGDYSFERVPARTRFGRRRVIHMFKKERPGQNRGTSIIAKVMASFRMLDHYQRVEMQTAVINSMIAAFIETPLDGESIAGLFGSDEKYIESRQGWDVNLEGAGVIPLHPGDKLNAFNPGRPNSGYGSFIETVARTIGVGLNMPYELLMRDFSKTNYSSARAALMEAHRHFLTERAWLVRAWCQPIFELWFEEAVNKGMIDAPGFYDNRSAYCRTRWIGPGRGWIDGQREAQAAETRMKNSMSTLEDECAEQGKDWEEVLEQRAKEKQYGEQLGLKDVHLPPAQGGAQVVEDETDEEDDDDGTGANASDPLRMQISQALKDTYANQ